MSATLHTSMTLAQFLVWEKKQEPRYEFDGFQPIAMTGGTPAHDRITFNLRKVLEARLAGNAWQSLGPNTKIIADGRARYPDAIVVSGPVSPAITIAGNPIIVFEVLSDGTANTDLIDKNREYRAMSSVQRYVILQQSHAAAIVFVRAGQDWLSEIVTGDAAALHLPEIGIDAPLEEIYAQVALRHHPANDPRE